MRHLPSVTMACHVRLHWVCARLGVEACECPCGHPNPVGLRAQKSPGDAGTSRGVAPRSELDAARAYRSEP